ncbi:MAG: cytochrome b/b6 domain-containing protein [Novosphingobium sp.]|nr:cytochrome b/b6 domain-containing protein [Novosphingobium sp.]
MAGEKFVKVWDLPTRLFHWLMLLTVGFSWWSAEIGHMDWHTRSGIAALILLVFRLIWGVIGSSTARFANFVRAPAAVFAHLRRPGNAIHTPGHNPLGGYSVVAMLLALAAQVGTGLFAVDVDGIESGPLSYLVSFDQGRTAAAVHHISFSVLQVLVVLHVLAIIYYRIRGRRLVMPMLTGRDGQVAARFGSLTGGGPLRAFIALAVALLLGWWISAGAPL